MRTIKKIQKLVVISILAGLLSLLAACGIPTSAEPTAGSDYPITITHKLGITTIKAPPKRIVALGETDQDVLLALGITPVAMVRTIEPNGITPWAQKKLGTGTPILLTANDNGFNVEQILALEPDLILANYDYQLEKYFDKLNTIVPTTAYETGPAKDSWQQVTRQVGKAVGKSAEAETLIADTQNKLSSVRSQYPQLQGKTIAFGVTNTAGTVMVLKSPEDTATKLLAEFGLKLPPAVQALPGDNFAVEISQERYDLLDADVLISYYNENEAHRQAVENNPLFNKLNVIRRGANVLVDLAQFYSLRTPSPLGIPYAIEVMVPKLEAAAQK